MVSKIASKEDTSKVSAVAATEEKKTVSSKTSKNKPAAVSKNSTPAPKAETKPTRTTAGSLADGQTKTKSQTPHKTAATKSNAKVKQASAKTVKTHAATVVNANMPNNNTGMTAKSKHTAVKENAQKAETKKFIHEKEEQREQECCGKTCCFFQEVKKLFSAWLDGYKKIFNYKERTNRYGFWAFMLINLFVLLLISVPYEIAAINALFEGRALHPALVSCYWIFLLLEILIYIALSARRLHDIGEQGWKGFYGPMTYSIVAIIVLNVVAIIVLPLIGHNPSGFLLGMFGWCILLLLFINTYYVFKTFIASAFMEEDTAENAYGLPTLPDACEKKKTLRYAVLYTICVIIYIIGIFYLQFSLLGAYIIGRAL